MQRIKIQQSKVAKGLGVFADEDIKKGELTNRISMLKHGGFTPMSSLAFSYLGF